MSVLLSICIPTYNREKHVKYLVDSLLPFVEEQKGEVELIVSNNCSKDNTRKSLEWIQSPYFTLYDHPEFLGSAEENMFRSVSLCQGEYIWFLGDDDVPQMDTVNFLLKLLKTRQYFFLYFNSKIVDVDGALTGVSFFRMNAALIELDYSNALKSIGFTGNFAGISNVVFKKSKVENTNYKEILEKSKIYSHVVWWLLSFADCKITLINRPLVFYRAIHDSTAILHHFKEVARKLQVGDCYFWTIGLINLFLFLEEKKVIKIESIKLIWDVNCNVIVHRLIDSVVYMLYLQIIRSMNDPEARNKVDEEDFIKCCDWILRAEPLYFECVSIIDKMYRKKKSIFGFSISHGELNKNFVRVYEKLAYTLKANSGYLYSYRNYSVYRGTTSFVAFLMNSSIDIQNYLRCVDPIDFSNTVICASTEEDLHKKIDTISGLALAGTDAAVLQRMRDSADKKDELNATVLSKLDVLIAQNNIKNQLLVESTLLIRIPSKILILIKRSLIWIRSKTLFIIKSLLIKILKKLSAK